MGVVLYFGKLNLITDGLFSIYNDPSLMDDLYTKLYIGMSDGLSYTKERPIKQNDGEWATEEIKYELHVLSKDTSYCEGWLYKESKIYYHIRNPHSKALEQRAVDSTEGIRFCLDIKHEQVAYNTTNRFGYKEFLEVFKELVNQGQILIESPYIFDIALITSGLGIDEINAELRRIGRIKRLSIRMQPPNPSSELLKELNKRGDDMIENMRNANVTTYGMTFESKGEKGINLESDLIENRIKDLTGLNNRITVEESTKKGYIEVDAEAMDGSKFSTKDHKPHKYVIPGIDVFPEICKDIFFKLRGI